jgi:hypothetical protein
MIIPEGNQKSIFMLVPQKWKKPKIHSVYPTEFAASSQNQKKNIETPNQPIETRNFSKKSMFSTSKLERSQKILCGLRNELCILDLCILLKRQINYSERKFSQKKYV